MMEAGSAMEFHSVGDAMEVDGGQEEGEMVSHLMTRASVLLQKELSALLLNRIPGHPAPDVGGVM